MYADRRVRLRDQCAAAGSPAALVSRPANVRLSRAVRRPAPSCSSGRSPRRRTPVAGGEQADGRLERELLRQQVLPTRGRRSRGRQAVDLARGAGADALAVEEHHLTVAQAPGDGLRITPDCLRDLACAVEQLRIVKDEDEDRPA
ncbi:aminopeptidase P family protein [Streptomyces tanashiensis]